MCRPPGGHQEGILSCGQPHKPSPNSVGLGPASGLCRRPLGLSSVASALSQACGTVGTCSLGQQPRWPTSAHSPRGVGDARAGPRGEQRRLRWRELSAQRRGRGLPPGRVPRPSCPSSCPLSCLKPQAFRPPHFRARCLCHLRGPVLTGQGDKRPSGLWFPKLEREELRSGSHETGREGPRLSSEPSSLI